MIRPLAIIFKSCLSAGLLLFSSISVLAFDDTQKTEIEDIIRAYLLKNPEIVIEMQHIYEEKQKIAQQEKQKQALEAYSDTLYDKEHAIIIGNPEASKTVVEFFDYNCPYCQRAMQDMVKIIDNDKDVKFVIQEWPVLGPQSFAAHRISLAFAKLHPEKYTEFHEKLLGMDGRKGEEAAIKIAMDLGADEEKLRALSESEEIQKRMEKTHEIASALGINGTPSYIIGKQVVFGAVGHDMLMKEIQQLK